jgi:glycosyltransferase involved in cell wall biosynthesis
MNIAIYIADLTRENQRLMPWRTVLEILHELKNTGHKALLLCGRNNIDKIEAAKEYGDIEVVEAPKPFSSVYRSLIANCLRQQKIDTLYFPISFSRDYSPLSELEQQSNCHIVWYVPGGWFTPKQILKAVPHIGIKAALPYLLQAFMPKRYFLRKLTSIGEKAILTMSEYTAVQLRSCGYRADLVFLAPPGKAPVKKLFEEPIVYPTLANQLAGIKYFLFFGPPSPIRGVNQIIDAFSALVHQGEDVKLVCLFRGDRNIDSTKFCRRIESASLGDQIICIWSSVSGSDLDLFLRNCFAVLKPFLIVPSEIPLAVLETAGYGKPVIGTGPDGTGAFIDAFGLTVPHADAGALACAMLKLLQDPQLYELKCRDARELYDQHPGWSDVAKVWLQAGRAKIS